VVVLEIAVGVQSYIVPTHNTRLVTIPMHTVELHDAYPEELSERFPICSTHDLSFQVHALVPIYYVIALHGQSYHTGDSFVCPTVAPKLNKHRREWNLWNRMENVQTICLWLYVLRYSPVSHPLPLHLFLPISHTICLSHC